VAALVMAATAGLVPAKPAGAAPALNGSDVVVDAEWTASAQLADGAIATYVDKAQVWPYLGNFAAMGLARAAEVTGVARYADGAWRWLAWYQAHQDASGFVTDYTVGSDGAVASTGDMDSTDAYAGTFLLAARRTFKAAPDGSRLAALRPGITAAVSAIEATQDADGLTWAKPSWRVKYLMDQAEVYAGLQAGAELAGLLGDPVLAQRAAASARRVAGGVSQLWNPATGAYDWAVHGSGARQATDWAVLYPDAQQQAWAVAFGLATGSRAKDLMSTFDRSQPNWDRPPATAVYADGAKRVGYWPVTGWAFTQAGRSARALVGATNIRSAAVAAGRSWPFTSANGAQLLELGSGDSGILVR
jgi:hypothetical protein